MTGKFITVEGNISSGKSTFTENIAKVHDSIVLQETVYKPAFRRLLGLYYNDPKRWGLTFQMFALKERFRQHTYASEMASIGHTVWQDRGIYADACFGSLVREDGNMTEDEWDVYAESFGNLKRFLRYPDLMVYLRVEPEVCLARLKVRARSEEANVPLDYLKRLHLKHEELAQCMARFTRVLVLDWTDYNQNLSVIYERIQAVLEEPVGFLRDFNRL